MEVHPDEGGVTSYIGGIAFIIVPAVSKYNLYKEGEYQDNNSCLA